MKRKININRPEITSEEIAKQQDFDSLLSSYNKLVKPFYKSGWFVTGVAAVVLIGGYFVFMTANTGGMQQNSPFISPPMASVTIPYDSYTVKTNEPTLIERPNGSRISIPANAFRDENGNEVKGEVQLKYREFHDQVDIMLSGIPMQYDSGGVQYQLESAGMLEILGFQGDRPVFIKDDKQIDIAMISYKEGTDYNLYFLDTVQGNWVNIGRDSISVISEADGIQQQELLEDELPADSLITGSHNPELVMDEENVQEEIKALNQQINKWEATKPKPPRKRDEDKYVFEVDILPQEFPELAEYNGAKFEVIEEKSDFNVDQYDVQWTNLDLKRNPKADDEYIMTISKGKRSHVLYVYPVYEGENYDIAKATFDKKFDTYKAKLADKIAEEKRLKEENEARLKQIEADYAEQYARMQEEAEERARKMKEERLAMQKGEVDMTVANMKRNFSINGFGIYNCDRARLRSTQQLAAEFYFDNGKQLKSNSLIYLIDKGFNGVVPYNACCVPDFFADQSKADIALITFLENNNVAIYRNSDENGLKKEGKFIFTLQIKHDFKTVKNFKDYIGA